MRGRRDRRGGIRQRDDGADRRPRRDQQISYHFAGKDELIGRSRIVAIVEIVSSGALGTLGVDPIEAEDAALAPLVEAFRRGQSTGEFRPFDPLVMARAVRAAVDSTAPRLRDPDIDLDGCTRELTTLFELATRNPVANPPART